MGLLRRPTEFEYMQKLTRDDLYSLEQYAEARDEFRATVLRHKRNRRLELGTNAALYFRRPPDHAVPGSGNVAHRTNLRSGGHQ